MRLYILAVLFLAACSSPKVHFTAADKAKYEPYNGNVRIFDSYPKNKPYKTIGDLSAEAYLSNPNEQVIHSLKREAAEHGANAIVMSEDDISSKISYSLESLVGIYQAPKTAKAVAIRVE